MRPIPPNPGESSNSPKTTNTPPIAGIRLKNSTLIIFFTENFNDFFFTIIIMNLN